jgi:preprotein translocase subunit YajC
MSPVLLSTISSIHTLATLTGPLFAAAAKKSTSSFSTLIFFVLLFGVAYMFLIRPQRQRRMRAAAQNKKPIEVGDNVMLSSGIYGRVESFVGDHARVEIAPGTVIEVMRQAISQRVDEPTETTDASGGIPSYKYDDHSHDDIVDDSGHDPYSVAPLEPGPPADPGDDKGGSR